MFELKALSTRSQELAAGLSIELQRSSTSRDMGHEILLVDDNANLLEAIGWALKEKGYPVTKASSGEEAIEILHKRRFALVVTDLRMRERDGIDVLRIAKGLDPFSMVIIMTGDSDVFSAIRALRGGADDYLIKPFNLSDLYERVAQCLEKQENKYGMEGSRASVSHRHLQTHGLVDNMSHDIRAGLVSLAAMIKLLNRGSYGSMDQEVSDKLSDLYSKVISLIRIAEEYLEKTILQDGNEEIEREEVDLRKDIIDPVIDELETDIREKRITIDPFLFPFASGRLPIKANKILLRTVYRNLFMNAIEYGGQRCTIAYGVKRHNSVYRLNVYNSGEPVPEDRREELFHRTGRGERGPRQGGNGLSIGLLLVHQIIRQHGGEIRYEAKEDGSDFVFTLPLQ